MIDETWQNHEPGIFPPVFNTFWHSATLRFWTWTLYIASDSGLKRKWSTVHCFVSYGLLLGGGGRFIQYVLYFIQRELDIIPRIHEDKHKTQDKIYFLVYYA
jgi:hypothetical protein